MKHGIGVQALEGAKSLEEVTASHSIFVDAVQRQCLLAPDKTWKLIEGVVIQILNQVLQFAELQRKLRKLVSSCDQLFCICACLLVGKSCTVYEVRSLCKHALCIVKIQQVQSCL